MEKESSTKEKVDRISTLQLDVSRNPNCLDANFKYAAALESLAGDTNGAIAAYVRCRKIDPTDAKTHNSLGTLLLRKNMVDSAILSYRSAIMYSPNYTKARSNLAMALVKSGQLDEAVTQLQYVIRTQPENEVAHNNLGISLIKSGRKTEAIVAFRRAIDLNPNYVKARENLQRIFSENRKQVNEIHASHDPEIVTELIASKNSNWVDVRTQIPTIEYNDFADCDWANYDNEFRNMVEEDGDPHKNFCLDSRFFCGGLMGNKQRSNRDIRTSSGSNRTT